MIHAFLGDLFRDTAGSNGCVPLLPVHLYNGIPSTHVHKKKKQYAQ